MGLPVYWVEGERAKIILNARAEVDGQALILHARGGAPQGGVPLNPDYQRALRLLMHRGQRYNAITRIAIDSTEARKVPPEQRTLFDVRELEGFEPNELAREIGRRLAAWPLTPQQKSGGNPTRRLRIETKYLFVHQRFRLKKAPPGETEPRQITKSEFDLITREHLDEAIAALRSHEIEPDFGSTTDYSVVLEDGTRLRPKAVVGTALSIVLEEAVSWHQFRGGKETMCFAVLRDHGFEIAHEPADKSTPTIKRPDPPEAVAAALGDEKLNDEEKRFVEGSVRRASHLRRERNAALVAEFKALFLSEHKRFHCERCQRNWIDEYGAEIAHGCFEAHHHATQIADMEEGHESTLKDLQLLCANCHRAVHREMRIARP